MTERLPPEPQVPKFTLDQRADSPEKKERLASLHEHVRLLEQKLFEAYPTPLRESKAQDVAERVTQDLLEIARDAREFGKHYGGYHVGGAALGLREQQHRGENPWVVLFDANSKWPDSQTPKCCAEQYLMDRAKDAGVAKILSFAVVAVPRPIDGVMSYKDDASKREQVTLTPCKQCRDNMLKFVEEGNGFIFPDTEVITADAESKDLWKRKYQRVKNLHEFHGEPDWQEIQGEED